MKETLIILAVIVVMMVLTALLAPVFWIGVATACWLGCSFEYLKKGKYLYALFATLAYAGFLICLFGK